ncbi:mucin-5AC-like [Gadus chalcogrammus]|uniref:mucin-5AC-like n=1 Tax=Gadus chalcogrammus TaxID=1042646 RepID=UPI0024C4CB92|nr:mucin-5AC-like [Gadus chalcogrammus]
MTCDWSDWFNLGEPTTGPNGGEDESIQKIIAAGHSICSAPEDVQCRAILYPNLPLSEIGQAVTCNPVVGLVCQNNEQGLKKQCLDYEIRVRCCSCHHTTSTTSPTTTITTTTVPPTTTPVSTTTPTKTSPSSTTKPTTTPFSTTTTTPTTPCSGIMTCEWSDWFNLGAPTTGPNGGEDESIQKIRADGHDICSAPEDVQCRATLYPTLPIKDLGQTITCNSRVGLVCENKMQTSKQDCLDYEIRVRCCTCRPITTTTTPSITTTAPPITTPVVTTTPTTTAPTTTTIPTTPSTTSPTTKTTPVPSTETLVTVTTSTTTITITTTASPTTTTVSTTPLTTTSPTTPNCSGIMTCDWSDWFNLGEPTTGPNGGEDESIQKIIAAGHSICSAPEDVQCRAILYPNLPLSDVGQAVTCNPVVGLVCQNNEQGLKKQCLDYEIRVRCCSCHHTTSTTSPTTTITTTTVPPTTTPVSTTTPTKTSPSSTTKPTTTPFSTTTPPPTTACLGIMTCEWSDWFNLGAPTTGPNGGEDESIQKIRADGHDICSAPEDVQCRSALYPTLPIKDLGQTITCNSRVGLVCENKMQTSKQDCLDYEIRVKCCTCRPITTTTTPSITTTAPPITTPVVTTTPTTTAPMTTTIPTTPLTENPKPCETESELPNNNTNFYARNNAFFYHFTYTSNTYYNTGYNHTYNKYYYNNNCTTYYHTCCNNNTYNNRYCNYYNTHNSFHNLSYNENYPSTKY